MKAGESDTEASQQQLYGEIWQKMITTSLTPWHSAPPTVKNIIAYNPSQNKIIIKPIPAIWELRLTQVNRCANLICEGAFYYVCKDCINQRIGGASYPYFCSSCFDPNAHNDHSFEKRVKESGNTISCECERCENHNDKHIIFPQMKLTESKQLLELCTSLLQIQCYLSHYGFETAILAELNRVMVPLLRSSVYYCRLMAKALASPVNIGIRRESIVEELEIKAELQEIVQLLQQDTPSVIYLATILYAKHSSILQTQPFLRMIDNKQVLQRLCENGIILVWLWDRYLNHSGDLFEKFILLLIQSQSQQNQQKLWIFSHIQEIKSQSIVNMLQDYLRIIDFQQIEGEQNEEEEENPENKGTSGIKIGGKDYLREESNAKRIILSLLQRQGLEKRNQLVIGHQDQNRKN